MEVPRVHGIIARRLLVNFRVEPDAIAHILPRPFTPKLVNGHAIAGICLIRLADIRPRGIPAVAGHTSENAAHRIAVQWEQDGVIREGVYIPRRDTNSRFNTLLGGRVFPGVHHLARFSVHEDDTRFHVSLRSVDGDTSVDVSAHLTTTVPEYSVFRTLDDASAFFETGAVGYSVTQHPDRFHGLELRSQAWKLEALAVDHIASSFFDDATRFPKSAINFDSAFLMRGVVHEWHALPELCGSVPTAPRRAAELLAM